MKRFVACKCVVASVLGVAMGLAAFQLGASVGDPVDPPGPGGGSGPGGGEGGGSGTVRPGQVKEITKRFATSLHATRRGKERFYSAYWDLNGDGIVDVLPGGDDDNGGFEHSVIEVYSHDAPNYDELGCKDCHYPAAVASTDTDTDDTLSPGDCTDCHWNYSAGDYGVPANDVSYCMVDSQIKICGVDEAGTQFSQDGVCIACHGRQGAEHKLLSDVHRDMDAANPDEAPRFTCMGCHQEQEVHGDTIALDSHLDAPKTSCAQSGCHEDELRIARGKGKGRSKGKKELEGACENDEGEVNERCETFHKRHVADVDCTACHVAENTSCNSCHFDSELDHKKRFYRQIPATGFKFLMNFKDIQDPKVTKVRTATYQSLTVGAVCSGGVDNPVCGTDDVETFVVFAPYASHSVTKGEDLMCRDCHVIPDGDGGYEGNPAVARWLTDRVVETTKWNPTGNCVEPDEEGDGCLEGPKGIIPLPYDWSPDNGGSLKMDFVYYLGNTDDAVTKNPAGDQWDFLDTGPDRGHMPYGTPLSAKQMKKLVLRYYDEEDEDDEEEDDEEEEEDGKKQGKR